MSTHRRFARSIAAIAAVLLLMVSFPMTVLGHAELETSTPAADSTVDGPYADPIVMTFTEGPVGESGARLRDSASGDVIEATTTIDGDTMTLTPASPLVDGEYEVQWTAVADDGHVERGAIRFTVVTPATPEPTASPSPTATATPTASALASATPSASAGATPSAVATPAASASGPDDADSTGGSGDVLLPILLVALLIGGLALLLFRRRDSSSTIP